jgi:hypothetical protein
MLLIEVRIISWAKVPLIYAFGLLRLLSYSSLLVSVVSCLWWAVRLGFMDIV